MFSGAIFFSNLSKKMLQFSKVSTQLNRVYDEIKSKLVLLLAVDNLRRL